MIDIDALLDVAAKDADIIKCRLCVASIGHPEIDELIIKGRNRGISWASLSKVISKQPSWGTVVSDHAVGDHGRKHLNVK